MRSANPVFGSLTKPIHSRGQSAPFQQYGNPYESGAAGWGETRTLGSSPYSYPGGPQQGFAVADDREMTVDDVITKTAITLGVIIATAILSFMMTVLSPGLGMGMTMLGGLGALITVFLGTSAKRYGSAAITLTYAVFEGLFVGGLSFLFAGVDVAGSDAGAMIGQAVVGTVGVFLGMLFVYKRGAVRVTPKFTRILTSMIIGVLVMSLVNMLLFFITGVSYLTNGGPLAILFSLVCIGLAASSFLQDFNAADELVRAGAPAKMAWGVALGLAVTLVWLYTEILRLLSYFRD